MTRIMNKGKMVLNTLNIVVVLLLLIITICGISAFNTSYSYEVVNQYGPMSRFSTS